MAFTANFVSTSFKTELLKGCHDFTLTTGDVFKLALYDNTPTFTAATTAYTATGEVAASGSYTAGGGTLTNVTAVNSGTTAFTDFADITFTTATISAYGCMIYNSTPNTTSSAGLTNPCVATLWFNGAKTSTAGDFTVVFPAADATNAVIRIA
jgi:hypothetical protein